MEKIKKQHKNVKRPCCGKMVKLEFELGQLEVFRKCSCGKGYFFMFKKRKDGKAGKIKGRGVLHA
jgi:hypothetical protein